MLASSDGSRRSDRATARAQWKAPACGRCISISTMPSTSCARGLFGVSRTALLACSIAPSSPSLHQRQRVFAAGPTSHSGDARRNGRGSRAPPLTLPSAARRACSARSAGGMGGKRARAARAASPRHDPRGGQWPGPGRARAWPARPRRGWRAARARSSAPHAGRSRRRRPTTAELPNRLGGSGCRLARRPGCRTGRWRRSPPA